MTSAVLAFSAGVLTVAAPCVLPVLPVVLGASIGAQSRTRPLFIALGFALAFAAVVLLFSSVTRVLGLSHGQLRSAAAVLLLCFGVLMVWPSLYHRISLGASGALAGLSGWQPSARLRDGALGGLLLGATLGVVWTPCAGPVLATILTLMATEPATGRVALLLLAYSLGAAVPMLLIAYGGQVASRWVRRMAGGLQRLQQGFGVMVVVVALALFLELDGAFTVWATGLYPTLATGL
jgi:cytochrome c-type biogenesis protein